MTTPTPPARGWYPDPEGGPRKRYWDGSQWHTQPQSAKKLRGVRAWWAELRAEQEEVTDTFFGHIAAPADAKRHFHWDSDGDGNFSRKFEGTVRNVGGVEVGIVGTQRADGSVTRVIIVNSDGADLDADAACRVAEALIGAADEIGRLT